MGRLSSESNHQGEGFATNKFDQVFHLGHAIGHIEKKAMLTKPLRLHVEVGKPLTVKAGPPQTYTETIDCN